MSHDKESILELYPELDMPAHPYHPEYTELDSHKSKAMTRRQFLGAGIAAGALVLMSMLAPGCSKPPPTTTPIVTPAPTQTPTPTPTPTQTIDIEQVKLERMYQKFIHENPDALQYPIFSRAYVSALKDLLEVRIGFQDASLAYNDYVAQNIANLRWKDITRQIERGQWFTPLDDESLKSRWSDPVVRNSNLRQIAFPTGLTDHDFNQKINPYNLGKESPEKKRDFIIQNLTIMYEFDRTYNFEATGPEDLLSMPEIWSNMTDPQKKNKNIEDLRDWWLNRGFHPPNVLQDEAVQNLEIILTKGQKYEIAAMALNGYVRKRTYHDGGIMITTVLSAKFGIPIYYGSAELKSKGFLDGFQVTALSDVTKKLLPNATIGPKTNGFGFYSVSKSTLDKDQVGRLEAYIQMTFDKAIETEYLRK